MKEKFIVSLNAVENVRREELAKYIRGAVAHWKENLNPEHRLTNLNGSSVRVKNISRPKSERKFTCNQRLTELEANMENVWWVLDKHKKALEEKIRGKGKRQSK